MDAGLSIQDMQSMTIGRIIDFCIESINKKTKAEESEQPKPRLMNQAEIDAYLGGGRRTNNGRR